jgi:hypothetical protein
MRFSKTSLKAHIWEQIGRLEQEYGFDFNNGSDQLKIANEAGDDALCNIWLAGTSV